VKPESPIQQVNRYLEIGLIFPCAIVVGLGIGYGLDHYFHKHFFYIVGLLLGIAAGFVTLVRLTAKPKNEN
jgi:F0F1-type ATP synthase assembly protein I